MLVVLIFIALVIAAYVSETMIEKNHMQSLYDRELRSILLPAVPAYGVLRENHPVKDAQLVFANAVISVDYFQQISAFLRNIFGGEILTYKNILERGRREAMLRLKQQVPTADIIVNMRFETATIHRSEKGGLICAEVLAYGTAITYEGKTFQSIQDQLRRKRNSRQD